jgi:hypothetical protein
MTEYDYVETCDSQRLSNAITKAFGKWSGSVSEGLQGTQIIIDRQLTSDEKSTLDKLVKQNLATEEEKKSLAADVENWKIRFRHFAILYWFECLVPTIDLDPPNLMIRAATEYEISMWGNGSYNHVIEYVHEEKHEDPALMDLVVLALLLFKTGKIKVRGAGWVMVGQEVDHTKMRSPKQLTPGYDLYTLEPTEVNQFKSFWKQVRASATPLQILIAGRRLIATMERRNLQDKLLDLMIAFECVVCTSKDYKKKNRPIQERISALLAGTPQWVKQIKQELDFGYKLRNDIVHEGEFSGGTIKKLNQDLGVSVENLCMFLEDILRDTLKSWLMLIASGYCSTKFDLIAKLTSADPRDTNDLDRVLKGIRRF